MDKNLFDRLAMYHATMAAARTMLQQGLIRKDEYEEIDQIFAKKYGVNLSVIYR